MPQAAIGVLGLHPDTLQRALTDQALGLMLPPTIQVSFHPSDPPTDTTRQPPAEPQRQLGSSFHQRSDSYGPWDAHASQPGKHLQTWPSLSRQRSGQPYSQQMSQQGNEELRRANSSYGWRRLSGGPDGAGFGGNRGSLWALVAPVGALVPMTMQVVQHGHPASCIANASCVQK